MEGTSPCGRFAVLIGCERRLGREQWSRFGNCCGSCPLKAWPSACRHGSGHNPTYSLPKPHLWVEVAQPTAVLVQIKGPSTAASSVLQWPVEDAYRKCKAAANCSMSLPHTHSALSVSSLGSYLIGTPPLHHHIIILLWPPQHHVALSSTAAPGIGWKSASFCL